MRDKGRGWGGQRTEHGGFDSPRCKTFPRLPCFFKSHRARFESCRSLARRPRMTTLRPSSLFGRLPTPLRRCAMLALLVCFALIACRARVDPLGQCTRRCRATFSVASASTASPSSASSASSNGADAMLTPLSISGYTSFLEFDTCHCLVQDSEGSSSAALGNVDRASVGADAATSSLTSTAGTSTASVQLLGRVIGQVSRAQPFAPPPSPKDEVCGADGRDYGSAALAVAAGTVSLHGAYLVLLWMPPSHSTNITF